MRNHSRWLDSRNLGFKELVSHIENYREWSESVYDPITKEKLVFRIDKEYPQEKSFKISNEKFTFQKYNLIHERLIESKKRSKIADERIDTTRAEILLLNARNSNFYIINRSHTNKALTTLRLLYDSEAKKNSMISIADHKINRDMFIWIIYKIINKSGLLDSDTNMNLLNIRGIKGEQGTNDRLQIDGPGTLSMTSSIVFLFEKKNIDKIMIQVEYDRHNDITFSLDLNGNIGFDFSEYHGPWQKDHDRDSKVMILIFMEVLPKIITQYENDIDKEKWNEKIISDFYKDLFNKLKFRMEKTLRDHN